jgi:hypothetical protein
MVYHIESRHRKDIDIYKTKVAKNKIHKQEKSYHKNIVNVKNVHSSIEIQKIELSDHPLILLQNVSS